MVRPIKNNNRVSVSRLAIDDVVNEARQAQRAANHWHKMNAENEARAEKNHRKFLVACIACGIAVAANIATIVGVILTH